VAGQNTEHRSPTALRDDRNRSLSDAGTALMVWPTCSHAWHTTS